MSAAELRRKYEALPEIKPEGFDRSWSDRLRSFDDFVENGPATAHWIRFDVANPAHFRPENPELWDLVVEAFPQG